MRQRVKQNAVSNSRKKKFKWVTRSWDLKSLVTYKTVIEIFTMFFDRKNCDFEK